MSEEVKQNLKRIADAMAKLPPIKQTTILHQVEFAATLEEAIREREVEEVVKNIK